MPEVIHTTCPYCGVGCGVDISLGANGEVTVRGDKDHPANFGKLCSKGSALAETIAPEGRLTTPLVNGQASDWTSAIGLAAERFRAVIDQHGPDAVAFYVSGQLLTEDYYVANKLMKGFIGSGNIDTNSRLCMSSSVAGHKRAFGSDTVPGNYEDLEQADLLVLTGSNTAWCHPVLYQRIVKAKRERASSRNPMRVVVVDPRRTATCDIADLHIALRPGTDTILFNGLLTWLQAQGHGDAEFVAQHTQGFDEALRQARWYAPSIQGVAEHCGVDPEKVEILYQWFARTEKSVTVYSQGVNQSSSGTDKVNSIINCHLLTGRIGLPGMGPFSVTGQPNAMGGREVGALSNQLAAHMDFERTDHVDLVERFWQASNMARQPGLKAVDLFRAIERGEVKALWVMATNPAVSLPDNTQVRRALEKCEFLVVSDCVETDTTDFADVLLPVHTWGEKNGTVTNSERRISRQRPFMEAPGESRPDWWILTQFAQRMGFEGFDYRSPVEIFREYARLSGTDNKGDRDFDISALQEISEEDYEAFTPVQWPVRGDRTGSPRLCGDGRFYTPDRRARFVPVIPRPPGCQTVPEYPMVLNTGRVRDHWHTMTRTGRSARLSGHVSEPYAEIHPIDAGRLQVGDGSLVSIRSAWGRVIVRARVADTQLQGNVFVPMHWSSRFAARALVDSLVNPELDPVSGQPEFKHTPVQVEPYQPAWHGFVLSRREINAEHATYWSRAWRGGLWHYEMAGEDLPGDWEAHARSLLCGPEENPAWIEMFDKAEQRYRAARFVGDNLDACIFIGPNEKLPPRDWLVRLFAEPALDTRARGRLLAGVPGSDQEDAGPTVCSCFSVGRNTLIKAIAQGATTPEAVGERLQAGTNCGSCIPELRVLIADVLEEMASATATG